MPGRSILVLSKCELVRTRGFQDNLRFFLEDRYNEVSGVKWIVIERIRRLEFAMCNFCYRSELTIEVRFLYYYFMQQCADINGLDGGIILWGESVMWLSYLCDA